MKIDIGITPWRAKKFLSTQPVAAAQTVVSNLKIN